MEDTLWYALTFDDVLASLRSYKDGLSEKEVKKRLEIESNALPERKRPSGWSILFSQFKGSLTMVLIVAGIVSFLLYETSDAIIIGITVLITVLFGFIQEYKAEQAFRLLASMLKPTARVIRAGREQEIPLAEVVVGDVVVLTSGSRIPADARVFASEELVVDESALTGESEPRKKHDAVLEGGIALADRVNMVYQGTVVAGGEGLAMVVAVGQNTELAKIAQSLEDIEMVETPLQKNLKQFVRWLTMVIGIMIVILFSISLWRGLELLLALETAIAVAVASIPEGLVISVTAMLALGARDMLKNQVLIRNLLAVETLGAVTVVCTDKTGTLTQGHMQVVEAVAEDELLLQKAVYFGSGVRVEKKAPRPRSWRLFGSPTEVALFSWVREFDVIDEEARAGHLDMIPFNSALKYRAVLYKEGRGGRVYVVGAPERVLKSSKMSVADRRKWNKDINRWAKEGRRVIGVATMKVGYQTFDDDHNLLEEDLEFVGCLVIADALRDSVIDAMREAQEAGVRVIMITGDNAKTALTIAKEAGIDLLSDDVIEGSEVQNMSDAQLKKAIRTTSVFARISPLDKLRIVHALQAQGEVLAMTGDGINDAAALKQADIGVAVGSAHDIAKESSDMVILDNDFASIVQAIAGGRRIYANVQKVVTFLLYGSFTAAVAILCSLLFGLPLPFLPAQILWVNIIEDALPGLAFVFEPAEPNQMQSGPRLREDTLLQPISKTIIFGAGLVSSVMLFFVFWWLLGQGFELMYARTVVFVLLGIDTFFTAFALKSLSRPFWRINPFNNMVLLGSLLFSYALYFVAMYVPFFRELLEVVPLDGFGWALVFIVGTINLFLVEGIKRFYR